MVLKDLVPSTNELFVELSHGPVGLDQLSFQDTGIIKGCCY